jgi:hypothetical protein
LDSGVLAQSPRVGASRRIFHLVVIKPSRYDADGYVIRWLRSGVPSNTLAVLNGLAIDAAERQVLGPDCDIVCTAYDETNTRIVPARIIEQIRRDGGAGLIGLVGVQSNQFPRAVDLAKPFLAAGIPVCIGGFHVSGCLAMLPTMPPDIQAAIDLGIAIFAGEAEEARLDDLLRDAERGRLRPVYNYMNDLIDMAGATTPILPLQRIERVAGAYTTFDAGRGCPFQCSFCTIINVQGRKTRNRTADDVERIIRTNVAQGATRFFITDDNFVRNREWEAILDRIIQLRERDGLKIRLSMQVDTLCHKVAGFIEKCGRAGVTRVFLGLESINPESLIAAKKRQNRITEYRRMLQAWKQAGVLTYAGYIMGFPADTPATIARDIKIIQHELPIDILEFFILTPLPGSEDHKKLWEAGVAMDPDMNNYALTSPTVAHPLMSKAELEGAYRDAWDAYFTEAHMATVMRRAAASGQDIGDVMSMLLWFHGCSRFEGLHPLEGGFIRQRSRTERRHGMGLESPLLFYPREAWRTVVVQLRYRGLKRRLAGIRRAILADPQHRSYTDLSLTPPTDEELDELEMFSATAGGRAAAARYRAQRRAGAAAG